MLYLLNCITSSLLGPYPDFDALNRAFGSSDKNASTEQSAAAESSNVDSSKNTSRSAATKKYASCVYIHVI